MESRRVIVTLELETSLSTKELKGFRAFFPSYSSIRYAIRQVQVNVIKTTKPKKARKK